MFSSVFISCDIVNPAEDSLYYFSDTISAEIPDDTQQVVVKKVLLFDFTGIRCTNCPDAHDEIHQLQSVYPGKIIPVAVHGTLLARPYGEFVTDLRTTEGSQIIDQFGINTIPIGLVDYFDANYLINVSSWPDDVANSVEEDPSMGINIENNFDNDENTLSVLVYLNSLDNFDQSLNLAVYLLEDSIITRQATTESPGYIENYVQMNVFRTSVSDVWGDEVFPSGAEQNQKDTLSYSVDFCVSEWDVNNCRIIAFVFDNTNKVINVNEAKVN